MLKAVSLAQTLSLGGYYVYENAYYLAGKGVLKGWTGEKITRWAKTSLKLFLVYVLMDYIRLWRTRQLREERRAKLDHSDFEGKREMRKEDAAWLRSAIINIAYTPPSAHWASEKGILSDGWVGAMMTLVGVVKFRAAWAATA